MAKSLPPVTWLRTFEAAARHLSFTAAARELGLTQSAVSQQVKALEGRLGEPLFLRQSRGLILTDAGRKLLPQVGAALSMLAGAVAEFDQGPADNLLTIAASVSIVQWVIAPHIGTYLARNPGLRVRFLGTIWPDDFVSTRAEVEIRFGSAAQVGHGASRLTPDDLIAVRAPSLTGPLASLPLIETVGTSDGWSAWTSRTGRALPPPTLFADSYGMALHLATLGLGAALVSAVPAAGPLADGRIVQADPTTLPATEGYYLATDDSRDAAQDFGAWLTRIVSRTASHPPSA